MRDKTPIEVFGGGAGWGAKDGSMEPLMNIEDAGNSLKVTLDLPCVKKEDIEVSVTEKMLEVKAKIGRAYHIEKLGLVQRGVEYCSFQKIISLPESVNPEKAESRFKAGMLEIMLPKKQAKKRIKVD